MYVELKQIEAFVEISKAMNFSKAADKMFVSQSTISARIKNLEMILGAPLFYRTKKDIQLSEFGEIYLPYAEKCLKLLSQGKRMIDEKKTSSMKVRIGVTNPFSSYVLPYVLPDVYCRFPDINIQVISVTHSENIMHMIHESQIDLGIINNIEALDEHFSDGIMFTTLYKSPLILVANPDHPLSQNVDLCTVSDLSDHKFIHLSSKTSIFKLVHSYFQSNDIKPASSMELTSVTSAKEIIKMLPLLTLLPQLVVNNEIQEGFLAHLKLAPTPPSLLTTLVCTKEFRSRSRELVHFLIQRIRDPKIAANVLTFPYSDESA